MKGLICERYTGDHRIRRALAGTDDAQRGDFPPLAASFRCFRF